MSNRQANRLPPRNDTFFTVCGKCRKLQSFKGACISTDNTAVTICEPEVAVALAAPHQQQLSYHQLASKQIYSYNNSVSNIPPTVQKIH